MNNKKDNIIFLDIDGVLTSNINRKEKYKEHQKIKDKWEWKKFWFDENCIKQLNYLVQSTNSKIVISSTWRKNHTLKQLQQIFKEVGFVGEIIGKTKCLYFENSIGKTVPRGCEIDLWLTENYDKYKLPLDFNYIILDDDSDMLMSQQNHYFRVDPYTGLTENIIYRCILFLNK